MAKEIYLVYRVSPIYGYDFWAYDSIQSAQNKLYKLTGERLEELSRDVKKGKTNWNDCLKRFYMCKSDDFLGIDSVNFGEHDFFMIGKIPYHKDKNAKKDNDFMIRNWSRDDNEENLVIFDDSTGELRRESTGELLGIEDPDTGEIVYIKDPITGEVIENVELPIRKTVETTNDSIEKEMND